MLNRDGISKTSFGAPKQILANVELQSSVGCIGAVIVLAKFYLDIRIILKTFCQIS